MPLCSLEIPARQVNTYFRDLEKAKAFCERSLNITHTILEIPDPEDREARIIGSSAIAAPRVSISFTIGPHEYPDFPARQAFFPSQLHTRSVGTAIRTLAEEFMPEISETRIEAWKNTTFIVRDPKNTNQPIPPIELAQLKEIGPHLGQLRLTLAIFPYESSVSGPQKEGETLKEPETYRHLLETFSRLAVETLGIPEDTPIQKKLLPTLAADTNFAVEFDCTPDKDNQITEELRVYLSQLVEQALNNIPLTKDGSAEIWIRQGQPSTDVITLQT